MVRKFTKAFTYYKCFYSPDECSGNKIIIQTEQLIKEDIERT
jgi:hypothetical protein